MIIKAYANNIHLVRFLKGQDTSLTVTNSNTTTETCELHIDSDKYDITSTDGDNRFITISKKREVI